MMQYEELKNELSVCRIGGLFLAVYEDNKIPELIIDRLQEELPEYFQFRLHITDEKLLFPIFFSQTYEHIGAGSNIFHILGIGDLSGKSPGTFIQSLQHGREQFKSNPYSIVFWIEPQFVKKLFHAAPDFHHWVFSTYDFTDYRQDATVTQREKEATFLKNTDNYLENLIRQYENWNEVKSSDEEFLLDVMERANLFRYYIETYSTDKHGNVRILDNLLDEFIADDQNSFMTLLGDFGTGKSSFSLHYFIDQAKKYLVTKTRRIPLFISLKDYPKKLNFQEFIRKEFSRRFGRAFSLVIFQHLALNGRFLLVVDGFDEMASMADKWETIENFKELTKLSFENLQFMTLPRECPKNKIFMTCRTHYFFTKTQEEEILKADYTVLYRNYAKKEQYQITRINIKEFNREQIQKYILNNTDNEDTADEFLKTINDTYNLSELSSRPLLLDMLVKTLPKLKTKQQINVYDLYRSYTNEWIERDDWRSQMTRNGKRRFMWELAINMYSKGGDFSLHYSQLKKPDKSFFKPGKLKKTDHDYFIYEATTCSFLNRDLNGNYKFIHKSFMEYFLAEYYFDCIRNKKNRPENYNKINKEIEFFLKSMISAWKDKLNGLSLFSLNLEKCDLRQANLQGANLEKANLESANLQGANLQGANLEKANLQGANLQGANLRRTNLEDVNLRGANLQREDLEGANLQGANLRWANLKGTNLKEASLINANLIGTYLEGADLIGADLTEAIITGADLQRANLEGAYLIGANLTEAIITGANLQGANLQGANLEGADLKGANLKGTNLENAFLDNHSPLYLARADVI